MTTRRVLFAPETFNLGETSRSVEVAREFSRRGHDVLFMGYSQRFASYVRDAGFELRLLHPELSEAQADALIAVDQGRAIRHPFTPSMVRERVRSELALIEQWQPDAIVIGTTLSIFLSARIASVPLAYVKPYPLSRGHLSQADKLPVFPGSSRLAATANRAAGRLGRLAASKLRWKPAAFRHVAQEYGLELPSRTLDMLAADIDLIASLFPYLDSHPLADNEVAVGPVYARSNAPLPPEVEALANRDKPVVYLGLGSSGNADLARAILQQLSGLDIEVVTSAGRFLNSTDRAALPPSVHIYDFVPAQRLNGLIDASIIHGGEGTVQTACASGVPFAGIGLQLEQRCNIDQCVGYGNALAFSAADIRRKKIPALVDRLLTDQALRSSASTLAVLANSIDGPSNCADQILRLITP